MTTLLSATALDRAIAHAESLRTMAESYRTNAAHLDAIGFWKAADLWRARADRHDVTADDIDARIAGMVKR